jgi:hypothetical protein
MTFRRKWHIRYALAADQDLALGDLGPCAVALSRRRLDCRDERTIETAVGELREETKLARVGSDSGDRSDCSG